VATLRPFRALRPRPAEARGIAAVPYDVVTTDEAQALADGNALSFLRVSRAEIELPAGTDPHSPDVYHRAAQNFAALTKSSYVVEDTPSLYLYRLRMGPHEQVGIAGCFALDEYDRNIIKKHERTRRDKEDDRTRHMLALGAQTGPVFLTYRARGDIDQIVAEASKSEALIDFEAVDRVRHTLWRLDGSDRDRLVGAAERIPALYIADGHHRAASAARARVEMRDRAVPGTSLGDGADGGTFLAVAFPHNRVQILPYNRVVQDLGGLSAGEFLHAVRGRFDVEKGPASPTRRGEIAMYVQGVWQTLRARVPPNQADAIASLDVTLLQDELLAPVLQIADVRTDTRIEFVGGARGTAELERLVDTGHAAVAFSLFPVAIDDLMAVSDAGAIMPPKSTWFEPKLRDGLLIHVI
jgi:uncharacterized protein (DUF1015 family)